MCHMISNFVKKYLKIVAPSLKISDIDDETDSEE